MKSKLLRLFACAICCFALTNVAPAQTVTKITASGVEGEEEEAGKSYVQSYFIVGLGITLGLVAICKSAGRRKKVRPKE